MKGKIVDQPNIEQSVKLNLGGGSDKIAGFLNVDILPLPEVDIVCDITKEIPLQDNSVDHVIALHVLEHIADTVGIMNELYRVCCNNAIIEIKTPYFTSETAFKDPTHVKYFTERTWEYFDRSYTNSGRLPNYLLTCNFKLEEVSYIWYRRWFRFLPFKKSFFLKHFWNIARTMHVRLRVVK